MRDTERHHRAATRAPAAAEPLLPVDVRSLLDAIARDKFFFVLPPPVEGAIAKKAIEELRKSCPPELLPAAASNYKRQAHQWPDLPDGFYVVRTPPCAEWEQSKALSTFAHQVPRPDSSPDPD